jgi:hypothetical protein
VVSAIASASVPGPVVVSRTRTAPAPAACSVTLFQAKGSIPGLTPSKSPRTVACRAASEQRRVQAEPPGGRLVLGRQRHSAKTSPPRRQPARSPRNAGP